MENSLLVPGGPDRRKQIQDAQDMYQIILRNAERTNSAVPPFEFLELIGKGSFGRVYKCREKGSPTLVAVKILNIDEMDFTADPRERDETVKDFRKEVAILQQLKDSGARNVNLIHDAFDLHSQLWIISDYCTGGSVRTLMRGNPTPGLEEHFIIPIARELAVAMKCVHDIGVIHRDIKCTNVYVTEDGHIQLGDFGIVGIMDDGASKRTTIIGTPWYMPREMHTEDMSVAGGYGKEVDIWSYGCTVYEMATGLAPNARVQQEMLGHVLEEKAPRLEGGNYSEGLRDFVAFCLNSDPAARPSADQILQHPYIAGTEWEYPTDRLIGLIERYMMWEYKGGQRTSLFNPGGAAAPLSIDETPDDVGIDIEDWNFTTSDSFNQEFGRRYSHMMLGGAGTGLDQHFDVPAGSGLPPITTKNLTPYERIQKDHQERSATRGEMSLDRLFNPESAPYEFTTPVAHHLEPEPASDLPLRNLSGTAAPRESTVMIDLDASPDFGSAPTFNFDFDDIPTIKAKTRRSALDDDEDDDDFQFTNEYDNDTKRATREWKFPTMNAVNVATTQPKRATMDWTFSTAEPAEPEEPEINMNLPPPGDGGLLPPNFRPMLNHTATAPVGNFNEYLRTGPPITAGMPASPARDSISSMIDLDLGDVPDPAIIPRPSTAESTNTEMTSGNPFDLEDDPVQKELDRNRFSYHKQWQSEGGNNDGNRSSLRNIPMHARGNSMSSTESELDRHSSQFPAPAEDVFGFDKSGQNDAYQGNNYNPLNSTLARQNLHLSVPHTAPLDNNGAWPGFGPESHDGGSPSYSAAPRLGDTGFPDAAQTNGLGAGLPRSLSTARTRVPIMASTGNYTAFPIGPQSHHRPILEFPGVHPPNPTILDDDATEEDIATELDRMLNELSVGLKKTRQAFARSAGLDSDDDDDHSESLSASFAEESDTGFESTGSLGFRSGDEEGL